MLIKRQEVTARYQEIDPAEDSSVRQDAGDQVKNDSCEVHAKLMWYGTVLELCSIKSYKRTQGN